MNSIALLQTISLLQPEPSKTYTGAVQFTITTGLVMVVFVIAIYYVMQAMRRDRDLSVSAEISEEFEKSKNGLLLAAQQKKAAKDREEDSGRTVDRETKEIELLKENVDPTRVIGQTCPLSRLEMMEDQELLIDPYTGQGFHFSSFLNDWPVDQERPKFIYRYPQGTIIKSENLISGSGY